MGARHVVLLKGESIRDIVGGLGAAFGVLEEAQEGKMMLLVRA